VRFGMLSKERVIAEAVTCRRGMALLAECATGQKEDGPVDPGTPTSSDDPPLANATILPVARSTPICDFIVKAWHLMPPETAGSDRSRAAPGAREGRSPRARRRAETACRRIQ
jgi:hypothetical protein